MAFPVPKDVRAARDFELIKGIPELLRTDVAIADPTEAFDLGEWVKFSLSSGQLQASKLEVADDISAPQLGCKLCWTKYREDDSWNGQSDVQATKSLTVLSGVYQAKTMLYNTASAFLAPGYLLIPIYDATNVRGYLTGVNPAMTPTAAEMLRVQAAVARSLGVDSDGALWFETIG